MNSDTPNTPREEMEARVTALLLGELSAEEAAVVRQAIEQDVELAQLHERLKRTISLVGEATASPGAPAAAQPLPLKLSDARRQKLLQHFKTVAPKEFSQPPRRGMRWYVPMSIAAALVAMIGAAMLMPTYFARTDQAKFFSPAQTATATEWGIVSGRARHRIAPGSLPSGASESIGMQRGTTTLFAENGRNAPNPTGSFPAVSPSQSARETEARRLSDAAPSRPASSAGTGANTIFLPSTDELADRSELSATKGASEFSSLATSAGRQENLQKLRKTMLPEVHYDSVPLGEVVKDLKEQARKISPPGVNLIVKSSAEVPSSPPVNFDPVTGRPLSTASPSGPVDLNNVTVRIDPPLKNVSLGDALDAVTKVADKELKLSVGENAVVLSQKDNASPELFTRKYKIDPNALQQLVQSMGIDSGGRLESGTLGTGIGGGGGLGGGGGGFGGGGGGGLGIPGITMQAPKSDTSGAVRQYLNNAGVKFSTDQTGMGGGIGGGAGGFAPPQVATAAKPVDSGVITQTASNRSSDSFGNFSNLERSRNQTPAAGFAATLPESKELSDQIAAVTDLVRQPGQSVASVTPPTQDLALGGMLQSQSRPDALSRGGGGRAGRSGAGGIDSPIPTTAPTTDESRKAGALAADGFGAPSNSDKLSIVPIRNASTEPSGKANFAENKPAGAPAPATIVAGVNGTATVSGGDSDRDGALRQKGVAWFDQSAPKTETLHDFDVGGIDGSKLADVALSKKVDRSNEFAKRLMDVDAVADIATIQLPPGAAPQPTVEKLNEAGDSKAVADLFSYQTATRGFAQANPNSELLGRSVTSSSGRTASAPAGGAVASTENFALGLASAKSLYLGDLSEKRGESFGRGLGGVPGSGPQAPAPAQTPADSRNLARLQMVPQAQSAAENTPGVPLTDLLPQLSYSSPTDRRTVEAAPQPTLPDRPSLNESIAAFGFAESAPKAPLPTTQAVAEVNRFYAVPVESMPALPDQSQTRTWNFSGISSPKEPTPEPAFRMDPQLMRRYGLAPGGDRSVEELNKKSSPPGAAGRMEGLVTNELKPGGEPRQNLDLARHSSNLAIPEGAVASSAPVVEYQVNAASINRAPQPAEPAPVRRSIVLPQQLAELNDEARLAREPAARRLAVITDDESAKPIAEATGARPAKPAEQRGRTLGQDTTALSAEGLESKASASSLVQDARVLIENGRLDEADVKLKQAAAKDPSNHGANYYSNYLVEARQGQEIRKREISGERPERLKGIVSTMEPETLRMTERDRLSAKSNQAHYEKLYQDLKSLPKDQLSSAIQKASPDPQLADLLAKQSQVEKELARITKDLDPKDAKRAQISALKENLKAQIEARSDGILDGLNTLAAASSARAAQIAEQEKKLTQAKEELGNLQKTSSPEQTTPTESPHDITPRKPAAPAAIPQPEIQSRDNAFSTFSLNVADVSFKLAAASLEKGVMPEPATVRSEEFINALDYRDSEPPPGTPIGFTWERARYPFAHNRDLLRFSVKTAAQGRQPGRPLNLVLLLDNSGSMERADRVRIVREALRVLAGQLQPQDKLSVIAFARTARLWADGVSGAQAGQAVEQVSGLTPEGGTNLEDAMNLGYQTALRHYLADGVNRIVLLTDGAANLGNVDSSALKQKVETHRKQGVALDCFGIGWEGLNDDLLEVLSRNGDGRYGFINTPEEAATGFAGQLAGALHVAASDVKVQVEFNPRRVTAYRQIGYAKHQLTKQQFRDNTVDAAEIAAAESGNALYVVETNPNGDGVLAVVRVRYKVPGTVEYREQEWPVPFTGNSVPLEQASPALRLAATASAFSEWLVSSPYAGEVTPDRLLASLSGVPEVYGADTRPKKLEWMIRQAKSLAGR
jgi:Mg-chelatase subunit ChlD